LTPKRQYASTDCDRLDIQLPEADESLVGRYSRVVIYYVAGWVLHKMWLTETIAKSERHIYFDFFEEPHNGCRVWAHSWTSDTPCRQEEAASWIQDILLE
jgi:hypothetical protein